VIDPYPLPLVLAYDAACALTVSTSETSTFRANPDMDNRS
jgi:hypothetical protein